MVQQKVKSLLDMLNPKILVQNTYLFSILSIFLVVYGPRLQPKLPVSLRNLFNNAVFRAVILFLISYLSSTNIQSSITITIIFLITINLLHTNNILETFQEEGFEIHNGSPLSCCDTYNKDSFNLTGTAFYPLHKKNDENNFNDDEINYKKSVKSIDN